MRRRGLDFPIILLIRRKRFEDLPVEVLWDDTIRLGIELRKKIRAVRREFEEKETRLERRWFFEPFVPDRVAIPGVSPICSQVPRTKRWDSAAAELDRLRGHKFGR